MTLPAKISISVSGNALLVMRILVMIKMIAWEVRAS